MIVCCCQDSRRRNGVPDARPARGRHRRDAEPRHQERQPPRSWRLPLRRRKRNRLRTVRKLCRCQSIL